MRRLVLPCRVLALLAATTATVIGFIAGFAATPALSYPWALQIVGALIGGSIALGYFAQVIETP